MVKNQHCCRVPLSSIGVLGEERDGNINGAQLLGRELLLAWSWKGGGQKLELKVQHRVRICLTHLHSLWAILGLKDRFMISNLGAFQNHDMSS